MQTPGDDGFALYPMVEETEAMGAVAGVYAALLTRMPFVPSLFKSLALCPGYLVLAYEQADAVLDQDGFRGAAQQLVASVTSAAQPPEQPDVRETLATFAGPLARMLLLSSGLLLALRGEVDAPPAAGDGPRPGTVQPERGQPTARQAPAPKLYGEIRASLQTPVVNTVWRTLADRGQLGAAWDALGPQVPNTRRAADALQQRSLDAARDVTWPVAATPAALERAGLGDAAPGMAAVLDAYVRTLPRVLALAASSAG